VANWLALQQVLQGACCTVLGSRDLCRQQDMNNNYRQQQALEADDILLLAVAARV
jgi:hypothetical protein